MRTPAIVAQSGKSDLVKGLVSLVFLAGVWASAQQPAAETIRDNTRVKPFRVIGNIYYIGFSNAGAYLVTTPEGHVLVDSGYPDTVEWLRGNIEQLGFQVRDIKHILTTHAHSDHVGGHAQIKELSGAQIWAGPGDEGPIADGGRSGPRGDGSREQWRPVRPDRVTRDKDTVSLGGTTLTARLTPGHTEGCTTWTTTVEEDGRRLNAVFLCSMGPPGSVALVNNPKYPNIVQDFEKSYAFLKTLPCDVFLSFHTHFFGMFDKMKKLQEAAKPNPFIDPAGCKAYLANAEKTFREQLAKERAAAR